MGIFLSLFFNLQAQTVLWKQSFSALGSGMTEQEAAHQIFRQVRKQKTYLENQCKSEQGRLDSKLDRVSCQRQGDFFDCVGFVTFTCTAMDISEEPR